MRLKRTGVVAATAALLASVVTYTLTSHVRPSGPGWREIAATQDLRYQAVPMAAEGWGPLYTDVDEALIAMKTRLGRAAHNGEGYRMRPSTREEWSKPIPLATVVLNMEAALVKGPEGLTWMVRSEKDGYRERAHRVDINPTAYADTGGTLAIDIIVGTMHKEFPLLDTWGIYACRHISGSYNYSQHAWANGVDFGGPGFDYMDRAAHYMLELTQQGWLPASQILWDYRNMLTGNYVYDHTNHIHVSGSPLRTGVPPCA